jgi:HSP20 family protein
MFVSVKFDQPMNELMQQLSNEEYVPTISAYPVVEITEYENESVVLVELPGVKKEDITISVENGLLTVKGVRNPSSQTEIKRVLHREIEPGSFERSIELPHAIDVNAVSAELENGLLKIALPKANEVRRRTITVK